MATTPTPEQSGHRIPRRILRQASTFVIVCAFLTFVNYMTSPGHWWVLWIIAGWGLSLGISLLHHWIGWDDDER